MRFNQDFLQNVVPQAQCKGAVLPEGVSLSVDSRTITQDQLFVAIEGSNVDGHLFLADALEKGCGALVAAHKLSLIDPLLKKFGTTKTIIVVENPLEVVYALARAWRQQLTCPIIGITGSIGKTTTKEYAAFIMRQGGQNCFASQGNQNTLLGIALNILKMTTEHTGGLFEVGIGARSEMVTLVDLLRPTTAVITYIGHSHMEGLGSLVDIASEKRKIFSFFSESNIGIINGDQAVLSQVGYAHPVIKFGQKITNQIQARKIKTVDGKINFVLKLYHSKYNIALTHTHQGMINNILAATALAYQVGIDEKVIVQALQNLPVYSQRFEVCNLKNNKGIMIDDCYNASPESVKAALLAFEHMPVVGKKIAVLGDMLELGEDSHFWHRQVGRFLKKSRSVRHLLLIGPHMKAVKETAPYGISIETAESWQDAVERLSLLLEDDNAVLVKGSRGMQLQNLVTAFASKEKTL
jgi:UDP-N-acetylmuramoyl-tripeptide--D-alanyl-D-alanine ligase